MLPELSQEEIFRYGRHLTIPEIGAEGQRKLKAASVLVVGVGGLGSAISLYLAAVPNQRSLRIDWQNVCIWLSLRVRRPSGHIRCP